MRGLVQGYNENGHKSRSDLSNQYPYNLPPGLPPTGLYSELAGISSSSQGSWCPLQQARQGEKYLKGRRKSKTIGSKTIHPTLL